MGRSENGRSIFFVSQKVSLGLHGKIVWIV